MDVVLRGEAWVRVQTGQVCAPLAEQHMQDSQVFTDFWEIVSSHDLTHVKLQAGKWTWASDIDIFQPAGDPEKNFVTFNFAIPYYSDFRNDVLATIIYRTLWLAFLSIWQETSYCPWTTPFGPNSTQL